MVTGHATPSRVLVADDDDDVHAIVSGLLGHRLTVDHATDGLDALGRVFADHPDLLIVGTRLSALSVRSLVWRVRDSAMYNTLPVLAILPAADANDASRQLRVRGLQDVDAFVCKPFAMQVFVGLVDLLLAMPVDARILARQERALPRVIVIDGPGDGLAAVPAPTLGRRS